MKSVLISIQPKWCEKIASGEKTIDVRKTAPQEVPFKAYIYESRNGGHRCKHCNEKDSCYSYAPKNVGCYNGSGKVIGEFVCNSVDEYPYDYCDGVDIDDDTILETAIDREDINIYAKGKTLYGWHISDLKIYDKPKELSEFRKPCDRFLDCCTCRRLVRNEYMSCDNKITRPPQSWCYVEDLGEEK
jgi:predicted transcriptional regulator|nr:MAG TPA: hypothetical protein [Bacteriophage sp.]